jgi:hypothetical protein
MEPKPAQPGGRRRDICSRFGVPAIIVMSLMIGTCSRLPGTYEQIRVLGTLKVATRNSPLAYYRGASGPEGPEYELAAGFARRLGVKLDLHIAASGAAAGTRVGFHAPCLRIVTCAEQHVDHRSEHQEIGVFGRASCSRYADPG